MFGFIKFIQITLKRIRENKRLWFTLIFIISSLGITLSIVVLTLITNNTKQKVFESQNKVFELYYKNFHKMKLDEFKRLSTVLKTDSNLNVLLSQGAQEQIADYFENLNNTIRASQTGNMSIRFYGVNDQNLNNLILSTLQTKNIAYGYSIMVDGVYNTYLEPVVIDGNTVGVLQLSSNLEEMRNSFSNLNKEYVFLINKNVSTSISLANKEENYTQLNNEYLYNNKIFMSNMLTEINSMSTKEFRDYMDDKYTVTEGHYLTFENVVDLNGVNIGAVVMGEKIDKSTSFLNITEKLANQVIMVALGLIVSMLLFMF